LSRFIFPQPDELGMPQVTIRRPFGELDLSDQAVFRLTCACKESHNYSTVGWIHLQMC
jgi:hypothetical protein